MSCFPTLLGDNMINWIKKFFVTEEKQVKPKCIICGLGAKYHMLIEFHTMESSGIDVSSLVMDDFIFHWNYQHAPITYSGRREVYLHNY